MHLPLMRLPKTMLKTTLKTKP
ncbi:hypothetical protein CHELA41_22909 [Hyphomicrobiales bacterium]|nr:hypothetical protein CHELA41_22909 [Hyphomicrobiales bacterium]